MHKIKVNALKNRDLGDNTKSGEYAFAKFACARFRVQSLASHGFLLYLQHISVSPGDLQQCLIMPPPTKKNPSNPQRQVSLKRSLNH